jgi:transcription elongation factor Elf1
MANYRMGLVPTPDNNASISPMVNSSGPDSFLCARCDLVLANSIRLGQLHNVLIKCPNCESYNTVDILTLIPPAIKYAKLVEWLEQTRFERPVTKTEYLSELTQSFTANLRRVFYLAALPALSVMHARYNQFANDAAMLNVVGSLSFDGNPAKALAIGAESVRLRKAGLDVATLSGKSPIQSGADSIERYGVEDDQIYTGTRAAMASVLLSAWTAFESLATDIWLTAVNKGPKQFAENVIKKPSKDTRGDGMVPQGGQEKSFSLSDLQQHNYDLREAMGDLLKERKKVDFQAIENIKRAYLSTFSNGVEKIFEGSDYLKLKLLESVRNLYAHRGGIIDQKFLDEVKEIPGLAALQKDSEFPIDGAFCIDCVVATVDRARALIAFVDACLTPPDTSAKK